MALVAYKKCKGKVDVALERKRSSPKNEALIRIEFDNLMKLLVDKMAVSRQYWKSTLRTCGNVREVLSGFRS